MGDDGRGAMMDDGRPTARGEGDGCAGRDEQRRRGGGARYAARATKRPERKHAPRRDDERCAQPVFRNLN